MFYWLFCSSFSYFYEKLKGCSRATLYAGFKITQRTIFFTQIITIFALFTAKLE
ncbi:Uncharacterised protein [Mycoplasmopsis columbinasalis]|uniref:Uncharacterized protein n=1 Tax=Mycoplasmopsis columbinasalis TaxID=114880 RepID=A0A449BAV2_9BACT|nr:Uncharacterised protein [Mycoplasmopsis columbinasalis]